MPRYWTLMGFYKFRCYKIKCFLINWKFPFFSIIFKMIQMTDRHVENAKCKIYCLVLLHRALAETFGSSYKALLVYTQKFQLQIYDCFNLIGTDGKRYLIFGPYKLLPSLSAPLQWISTIKSVFHICYNPGILMCNIINASEDLCHSQHSKCYMFMISSHQSENCCQYRNRSID